MEVNALDTSCSTLADLHADSPCDISLKQNVTDVCDGDKVVEFEENDNESKEEAREKSCENNTTEQGLIDGGQTKILDSTYVTEENSAKTLYHNVIHTPSPKSILRKHSLSVSPRSKKLVRFALMSMDEKICNKVHLHNAEESLELVNGEDATTFSDKFNEFAVSTTSQADTVVHSGKNGITSDFSDQIVKSMSVSSHNMCAIQADKVKESESVRKSVSDKLKSLVTIVRESSDGSIDSSRHCGVPEAKDCTNEDLNQNTKCPFWLAGKSHLKEESKFGSPSKNYSDQSQSSPKTSFLISRGFPRIVLRDKSNKPQRVRKTVSGMKSWKGEEYLTKCVETTQNSGPKLSDSAIVELSSGESLTKLKKDRECVPAVLPCTEDNRLSKVLEVSLEKIDENLLIKYGLNLNDNNHTSLNKCSDKEDITSLRNVNDELKENTDIEVQNTKRTKNLQICEKISPVGKKVGDFIIKDIKTTEDLEEGSSKKICSANGLKQEQTSKIKRKVEKLGEQLIQETDTSLNVSMANEENNNEASVPSSKPLSTSFLKSEFDKKYVRIHITRLDPVLLSKYGIDLEHLRTANSNAQLMGHNKGRKVIDKGLAGHKRKTSVNNKKPSNHNSKNSVRRSRKSLVSNDPVVTEVVNFDQGTLDTVTQKKRNSNISDKSKASIGANSHDLKMVKGVTNNKMANNTFNSGDVETVSRKVSRRHVRRSSEGSVYGHESTSSIPLILSKCSINLKHQNAAGNNVKNIENKVNYEELTSHKNRVNNKKSTNNDSKNKVGRSRKSLVSNDPIVTIAGNSEKSDQDPLETVTQEKRHSDVSEKSRENIVLNSHDLKNNTVVNNKPLPDDTSNSEDAEVVPRQIPRKKVKRFSEGLEDLVKVKRSSDDGSTSSSSLVLLGATEFVNSDNSVQDTLETVSQEKKHSDMSEKSRESIGSNSHDLKNISTVSNKPLPHNSNNSGDAETVSSKIPHRYVGSSSDCLLIGPESTPKPVDFSQKMKRFFSKGDSLLTTSVSNGQVPMVCLSRIDCDLSKYGIDKSQLLGSSCEKVSVAKETNTCYDEGSILAKPNDKQTGNNGTSEISSFNSPFKSKKRKRESVNSTVMVSPSSEKHLRSIKRCKRE